MEAQAGVQAIRRSAKQYWVRALIVLFVALVLILLAREFVNHRFPRGYLWAMGIGGSVGAVELLGRYRYSPWRAILTLSAFVYICVNIGAAAVAYYMLGPQAFGPLFKDPAKPLPLEDLKNILLAGFGALAFLRSSFFKVRVGDADVGIGPAAILDTLLMVADRGVDRAEAVLRAQEVRLAVGAMDPEQGANLLTAYCIALMQNVSNEERAKIEEAIRKITSNPTFGGAVGLDLIALQLSNLVGSAVLEAAVQMMGERGMLPTALKPDELKATLELAERYRASRYGAEPARFAPLLTTYCLALRRNVSPEEKSKVDESLKSILGNPAHDDAVRNDLVVLKLATSFGANILKTAFDLMGIDRPQAAPPGDAGGQTVTQSELVNAMRPTPPPPPPAPPPPPPPAAPSPDADPAN